jgi:hypothetical protein
MTGAVRTPTLTVADLCIWHGCGTNLSRRQSATAEGALADQARVCLAAPHRPQPRFLGLALPRASHDGRARDDGRALSLGSSSFLESVAALTCGGAALASGWPLPCCRVFPVVPRHIWHEAGTRPSAAGTAIRRLVRPPVYLQITHLGPRNLWASGRSGYLVF